MPVNLMPSCLNIWKSINRIWTFSSSPPLSELKKCLLVFFSFVWCVCVIYDMRWIKIYERICQHTIVKTQRSSQLSVKGNDDVSFKKNEWIRLTFMHKIW